MLTEHEREFLAAFINEATTDPFKGPATEELHRRDIYYNDLSHLMAAYYYERPANQEGFGGRHNPLPPPCPWPDRATAVRRDQEEQEELDKDVLCGGELVDQIMAEDDANDPHLESYQKE
jgi:hypothetical protein